MTKDIPDNLVRRSAWPSSVSRAVGTPLQPSVVYASPDPDTLRVRATPMPVFWPAKSTRWKALRAG